MSYTIADLDHVITDEANPWEGSWYQFEDALESTREAILDDNGNPVREKSPVGNWYNTLYRDKGWRGADLPGIGRAELVESHGGGEGSGEERWYVFTVKDAEGNTRVFRRNGYYASFHGSDFDGPTEEVKPVLKQITVFEAVA